MTWQPKESQVAYNSNRLRNQSLVSYLWMDSDPMLTAMGWSKYRIRHLIEALLMQWGSIIFVHGLGSNPDTTWTSPVRHNKSAATDNKKTVSWITDFLPQDLQPSIREHTRVYYYNHDSYWKRDAIETRLYRLGEGLLQRIRLETRRNEEVRISYWVESSGATDRVCHRNESVALFS